MDPMSSWRWWRLWTASWILSFLLKMMNYVLLCCCCSFVITPFFLVVEDLFVIVLRKLQRRELILHLQHEALVDPYVIERATPVFKKLTTRVSKDSLLAQTCHEVKDLVFSKWGKVGVISLRCLQYFPFFWLSLTQPGLFTQVCHCFNVTVASFIHFHLPLPSCVSSYQTNPFCHKIIGILFNDFGEIQCIPFLPNLFFLPNKRDWFDKKRHMREEEDGNG